MKPVRWGVLSPARIGMEKVLPAMLKSRELEVYALASRDFYRLTHGRRYGFAVTSVLLAASRFSATWCFAPKGAWSTVVCIGHSRISFARKPMSNAQGLSVSTPAKYSRSYGTTFLF